MHFVLTMALFMVLGLICFWVKGVGQPCSLPGRLELKLVQAWLFQIVSLIFMSGPSPHRLKIQANPNPFANFICTTFVPKVSGGPLRIYRSISCPFNPTSSPVQVGIRSSLAHPSCNPMMSFICCCRHLERVYQSNQGMFASAHKFHQSVEITHVVVCVWVVGGWGVEERTCPLNILERRYVILQSL